MLACQGAPSADTMSSVVLREGAWEDSHQRGTQELFFISEITIQSQMWPLDQFVEPEHSVNHANHLMLIIKQD